MLWRIAIPYNECEKHTFKIIMKSPRDQWVNALCMGKRVKCYSKMLIKEQSMYSMAQHVK